MYYFLVEKSKLYTKGHKGLVRACFYHTEMKLFTPTQFCHPSNVIILKCDSNWHQKQTKKVLNNSIHFIIIYFFIFF